MPPVEKRAPSLHGKLIEGRRLQSPGVWSNAPTRYMYTWEDCSPGFEACRLISGASPSSSSYRLKAQNAHSSVKVLVRASNAAGTSIVPASVTSTRTVPARRVLTPRSPATPVSPLISGTALARLGPNLEATGTWTSRPTEPQFRVAGLSKSGAACCHRRRNLENT